MAGMMSSTVMITRGYDAGSVRIGRDTGAAEDNASRASGPPRAHLRPSVEPPQSQLPDLLARPPLLAGGVAEIDHHVRPVNQVVVIDARVRGHDRDAVVGRRVEPDGREAGLGQLWHERVVVGDLCTGAAEEFDQLD